MRYSAGRVVNEGSRPRKRIRDYSTFGKGQFGNAPYLQPQMDWDSIRRAKLKCISCELFDVFNGGCIRHILPGECDDIR